VAIGGVGFLLERVGEFFAVFRAVQVFEALQTFTGVRLQVDSMPLSVVRQLSEKNQFAAPSPDSPGRAQRRAFSCRAVANEMEAAPSIFRR
jgi:hypothetical protein